MAIHEDVPGIEAVVRCRGQPLPELEDPHSHDDDDAVACLSTTKYIECVDDAEFDIYVQVSSAYLWGYRGHILLAGVYVDGKRVRSSIIRHTETAHGALATRCVTGREVCSRETGTWSLRKFKFAAVKTIDDAQKERVESDIKAAKGLGTIEIKFTRAIECGPSYSRPYYDVKPRDFELAEKSLKGKAVSHGTSYGAKEAIAAPQWVDAREIAEDNGPILILKFMYRSRDALKRELIIPRSPSHSPDFENLTPAERDRLARERLNELREQKVKRENRDVIKREIGEVFDLTEDAPAPRPTKKSRLQDGTEVDVVDLTDD